MSDASSYFATDIAGIRGKWPVANRSWSYSSLVALEACEARWMFEHASYPDLWDGSGYPSLPGEASLFGEVVHDVIETLVRASSSEDGGSMPAMLSALVELGGWDALLRRSIHARIASLDGNPRVRRDRVERLRDRLMSRIPSAADHVKSIVQRTTSSPSSLPNERRESSLAREPGVRGPLGNGTHIERSLSAENIRLTGRVDRLVISEGGVVITDFKTGAVKEAHGDQVRLYALLWSLDSQSNPSGRLATQLRVDYPSHGRDVAAPGPSELHGLKANVEGRIANADGVVRLQAPAATPTGENCGYCQVKHLCGAYWAEMPRHITQVEVDEWFDLEVLVVRPNGARSWFVETTIAPATEVLVRTVSSTTTLPVGERIRLLNVRKDSDPDSTDRLVVAMSNTSEWYRVAPRTEVLRPGLTGQRPRSSGA